MLALQKYPTIMRIVVAFTLAAFIPTSVQAWQFMPQIVFAADPGAAEPTGAVSAISATPVEETQTAPSAHAATPTLPERVRVAAAAPLSLAQLQSAAAGQTAEGAAILSDAQSARDAGDLIGAAGAYLSVIERHPRTAEGHSAVYEIIGMLKGSENARLDEIEASLPAIEALSTPEARLVLGNYFQVRGKRAKKAGDRAAAAHYFALTKSAAWNAMIEFPNDPLQVLAVDAYLSAAEEEGAEATGAAARELESLIATQGPNFTTWSSHLLLGNYLPRERKHAEATLHFGSMLDALEFDFVQNALKDPGVLVLLKAWIHYGLGMAYANVRDYESAMLHYEQVMTLFPYEQEEVFRLAAFGKAYLTYVRDPNAVPEAIALMETFLTYEGSLFNDRVLLEIASLYAHQGDYAAAEMKLNQFLAEYPDSEFLGRAQQTLDFLQRHLLYSAQVVGRTTDVVENPLNLAQACGPIALQKLLATQGVDSRLGELMVLAGTDDSGTTMHGLITAAQAKGVTLSGVDAGSSRELATPFIAFVDDNHFVLVSDVQADGFVIEDSTAGPEKVTKEAFAGRWQGLGLVLGEPGEQQPLQLSALKGAKGGWILGLLDDNEVASESRCALVTPMPFPSPNENIPGALRGPLALSGISSPGVGPAINTFRTSLMLSEKDIQIGVRGNMSLNFSRSYANPGGFHRTTFQGTDKPWKNIIGDGWSHSYNVFLKTTSGTTPLQIAFFDESGTHRYYVYATSDASYDYYYRSGTGAESEKGNVLKRVKSNGTFQLVLPNKITYHFSAQTTDSEHFARLEKISDESGNEITLTYDGAVGVGKLTKVAGPSGDVQHLALTYTGNLITEVELKENTAVLQTFEYAYTNDELTTVTDNDGWTVGYAYGSDSGTTGSRYIASITDKRNNTSYFTWSYASGEAYAIVVEAPSGLETTYERDLSTDKCVITNSDGTTDLTKFVNHPVPGNLGKSSQKDYFLDIANNLYESWLYEYTVESGTNYDVETVKTPQNSMGQHVVAGMTKYDSKGRVVSERIGTNGPASTYTYSGDNPCPGTVTDPAGINTTYAYSAAGQLTQIEHPAYGTGNSYDYTYDTYGQLDTATNPKGDVIDHGYDSYGRLTSTVVDPTGLALSTSFVYDDAGNVTAVTDAENHTTTYNYDSGGCNCGGGTGKLMSIVDPLSNETAFEYDTSANVTKVTDALSRSNDYAYDNMNHLTTITSPSGSANTMTMTYNILGLLESRTDFEGKATEYVYDYLGRLVEIMDATQTPAEPMGASEFNYFGGLAVVTDGLDHVTTYDYSDHFLLATATDPIGKQTHYTYDDAGRVVEAATGSTGTVDPTEYIYSDTTGLLTTVRYSTGANTYDVNYFYNDLAQTSQIVDWFGGNGLRYEYDAAGRLTDLIDYDDSTLTYAYDDVGNVTSITDYHNNTVSYSYDAAYRLSSLTAPGNRVWTSTYNDLGRPTRVDMPNGMHTTFAYDTQNRLTAIDHLDGTTTMASFDYTLDDSSNVTRATHLDGSYWDYGYDGRNRLISADRKSANGHIVAAYDYTYDGADNLITKKEPFLDSFTDKSFNGWNVWGGTWSAANGYLAKTATGNGAIARAHTDADGEMRFDYRVTNTSTTSFARARLRCTASDDFLYVVIRPTAIYLGKKVGGVWTSLGSTTVNTTQNQWYAIRAEFDGSNITVWRSATGQLETQLLTSSSAAPTTTSSSALEIADSSNAANTYEFDNIRILSDSLSNTITYTVNNANELTRISDPLNGTIDLTYDDWGRTTQKSMTAYGTPHYTADYSYRYGDKLTGVSSNFPGEGNVSFDYGGDEKRRSVTLGGVTIGYNWDMNWNVINEENDSGSLTRTYFYIPDLPIRTTVAHVDGTNPATGAYNYYTHDYLGSTHAIYNANKSLLAAFSYTPYGEAYSIHDTTSATHRFTGHDWNQQAGLYFAPYRYYQPSMARWITRDPLGVAAGPNGYVYSGCNPIVNVDPLGLWFNPWGLTSQTSYLYQELEVFVNTVTREVVHPFSWARPAFGAGSSSEAAAAVRRLWDAIDLALNGGTLTEGQQANLLRTLGGVTDEVDAVIGRSRLEIAEARAAGNTDLATDIQKIVNNRVTQKAALEEASRLIGRHPVVPTPKPSCHASSNQEQNGGSIDGSILLCIVALLLLAFPLRRRRNRQG